MMNYRISIYGVRYLDTMNILNCVDKSNILSITDIKFCLISCDALTVKLVLSLGVAYGCVTLKHVIGLLIMPQDCKKDSGMLNMDIGI